MPGSGSAALDRAEVGPRCRSTGSPGRGVGAGTRARCADCGKDAPDRLGSLLAHKAPSRALLAVLDRSAVAAGGTGGLGGPRRPRSGGVVRPSRRPGPSLVSPPHALAVRLCSCRAGSSRRASTPTARNSRAAAEPVRAGCRGTRTGSLRRRSHRILPASPSRHAERHLGAPERGAGPGPTAFADAAVRVARSVGRGPGSGPRDPGRGSQYEGEAGP